jgi:large subunit ribosomal protein L13
MKKTQDIPRRWHLIDLQDQILGRVSARMAVILIGKNKPNYLPNFDLGDYIVAINAAKIKVTGKKLTDKVYASHSGYPGGLKQINLGDLLKKDPRKVIEKAVKGMLPKNKLQTPRLRRLKVFSGAEHPYATEIGLNSKKATLKVKS